MFTEFLLTDGAISIDLLAGNKTGSGISIARYTPGRIQAKDGGVWADNPMAAGRRVVHRVQGNVSDVLEIQISYRSQNQIIQAQEELDELLEKAHDYWTSNWQSEPVWIQAQAQGENHRRYALVYGASWAEYPDPFHEPYAGNGRKNAMAGIQLGLERSAWMNNAPGTSTALATSNAEHTDEATTGVFVGNYIGIGLETAWTTSNKLLGSLPYALFSSAAANTAIYFGSAQPFKSIVLNIGTPMAATSWTIKWEYSTQDTITSSGATWGDLTGFVGDESNSFALTGAKLVHWIIPETEWKKYDAVGDGSKFFVRARITAMSSNSTLPTQVTRHVYVPSSPYVELAATAVGGNMDALALVRIGLHSSAYSILSSISRYMQQILVGLRSVERGENFTAYINPKTADNASGITVTLTDSAGHANTAYTADAVSGYPAALYWIAATGDTMDEIFRVELDSSIAQDFFGRFRLFVRCGADTGSTIRYRLKFSNANTYRLGDTKTTSDTFDGLLDLGAIEIPPTSRVGANEEVGTIALIIEGLAPAGGSFVFWNVMLLPVDEWSAHITGQTPTISANCYVDLDAVGYPKQWSRAIVRDTSTLQIIDDLEVIVSQAPLLHANTQQRLWFIMEDIDPFWATVDVQVKATQRYFNLRSD